MRPVYVVGALVASLGLAGCSASNPRPAAPFAMPPASLDADPQAPPPTTDVATATTATTSNSVFRGRPATRLVVLRPVHNGKPTNGYTATPQLGHRLLSCHGVSPGAVNRGIYRCGTTADYGVACWRATLKATMYCLQNPFGKQLAQLPLTNPTLPGVAAPLVASPLALVLDDGAHCQIRDGGSWAPLPGYPDWLGSYSCNTPDDQILWAHDASDGVNRASRTWTVTTTGRVTTPVTHAVTVAYFAGN